MIDEILKTNKDNCEIFEKHAKVTSKPVAVKFFDSPDEIPEGIDLIDETIRHCQMVKKASFGEKFYSTLEQQQCKGGAGALGLGPMPPKVASGETYYNLGRFESLEIAKDTVDELSVVPVEHKGIIYAPLDEATYEPDVIVIISEPISAMKIAQALVYNDGDKVRPNFAGIQSLCGDAVANPIITKGVNITMGCDGSRKAAKVKDNELAIGIAKEKIEQVVESLMNI
ncbi:MAG: DUF169 domain-containing protein [Methanobrevibacter sp.]|uniref:DUF169 domain-containing protein n=1 Tax=Methanobrevibacter sp. TaxID=66852 RepID=UPI0026DFCB91|nr:DUF169 domain-containing protein [Methanobrevibacter sp.]MDO5849226.1 DUF169 domain-containing protein [Methanobrevibacter sp.]